MVYNITEVMLELNATLGRSQFEYMYSSGNLNAWNIWLCWRESGWGTCTSKLSEMESCALGNVSWTKVFSLGQKTLKGDLKRRITRLRAALINREGMFHSVIEA